MRNSFLILSFGLVCLLAIGCGAPSETETSVKADMVGQDDHHGHSHDDDGHGHDEHGHAGHDHDIHVEEMGPNKGHIIRLTPTDYMAEWRHYKGNNVIRMYVLDSNKKTVEVKAEVFVRSDTGKSKETFVLFPEDGNDEGEASVYMLDEQGLANAMNLGVTVTLEIDGKEYSAKVPPHAPHHH